MVSFSQLVKQEIMQKKFATKDRYAILLALIKMVAVFEKDNNVLSFHSSSQQLIAFIQTLLTPYHPQMVFFEKLQKKMVFYHLNVALDWTHFFKKNFVFDNKNQTYILHQGDFLTTESAKRAFIAGVFIATGSVHSPKISKYHLEIQGTDVAFLKFLQKLINSFSFNFKMIYRRQKPLLYIKNSGQVADFLKLIDASNAVLTFENERIARDMVNSINRLNNIDISNQQKAQFAAQQQIMMINFLKKHDNFFTGNSKHRQIANLRLNNPDASLNELCDLYLAKYQIYISKSGINHIMREIKGRYLYKKQLYSKNHQSN